MRRVVLYAALLVLAAILLAGCQGGGGDDPAVAAESYLTALVEKDADSLAALSCAAWEENAILELDSFQAVEIRLEGMDCQEAARDGETAVVSCAGSIVATYNEEDQQFPLDTRGFAMQREGGEWRVCGYQ